MACMDNEPRRRPLRFSLRTLFELIALLAFILTLVYFRQPTAEQSFGRYQLSVIRDADSPVGSQQWVIDTWTGEVWRLDGAQWHSRGTAPQQDK